MSPQPDPLQSWLEDGAPGFCLSRSGLFKPVTALALPLLRFMGVSDLMRQGG